MISCLLMWIASMVLLRTYIVCLHLLHCGSIPVYLLQCLPCMYCNAILVSFLLTAPQCSLSLFSSILPVSPMYAQLHSAQGTWYTTPFFFYVGCGSFVHQALRRVALGLKVALISKGLHTRSILSLIPLM